MAIDRSLEYHSVALSLLLAAWEHGSGRAAPLRITLFVAFFLRSFERV